MHRFEGNLTEAAPRGIQHHQPCPRPSIRRQCIDLLQGQVHHTVTCEYVRSILTVASGCGSGAPRDGGHTHLISPRRAMATMLRRQWHHRRVSRRLVSPLIRHMPRRVILLPAA